MKIDLVHANAVVGAHHFNPSVTSQLWMVDNGVVDRDEFEAGKGSVFSDMMANVVSRHFTMLITPDQVQLAPSPSAIDPGSVVQERLGALVRALPHTPYTACGLNITWWLDHQDVAEVSRRLFFPAGKSFRSDFDVPDARFGGYMSRPWFDGRLKLDVKPITLSLNDGPPFERLQFAFNFHRDVHPGGHAVDSVLVHLGYWSEAVAATRQTMTNLERELSE